MFGGNTGGAGLDARMRGEEKSAQRKRSLAVAMRPGRGVFFWRPLARIGDRKEAWGVGRPREVRDAVSWARVGGLAILC